MKKIKGSNLIIKYVILTLLLSAFSVLILSAFLSFIYLKFDIDIAVLEYASVAVCALTAAFTGYFSVKGFKNNGFALGAISALPLIIYSLFNLIFNSGSGIIFIIKLALCVIICGFSGAYSLKKSKRIKVK